LDKNTIDDHASNILIAQGL